jgi:hypothetical protein
VLEKDIPHVGHVIDAAAQIRARDFVLVDAYEKCAIGYRRTPSVWFVWFIRSVQRLER